MSIAQGMRPSEIWKAAGLCSTCGKNIPNPGKLTCEACCERDKELREQRKEAGLCIRCRNAAPDGATYCDSCNQKSVAYIKNKLKLGICCRCSSPRDGKGVYCSKCKEDQKKERQDRKARGVCMNCGLRPPKEGMVSCEVCDNRRRFRVKKLISDGLCTVCGKEKAVEGKRDCEACSSRKNEANKKSLVSLRREVFLAYGNECYCCKESRPEFLSVEHLNNDGAAHRKSLYPKGKGISTASIYVYRWLKKNNFPKQGFALACMNCNCARAWHGICPHERERQEAQQKSQQPV